MFGLVKYYIIQPDIMQAHTKRLGFLKDSHLAEIDPHQIDPISAPLGVPSHQPDC